MSVTNTLLAAAGVLGGNSGGGGGGDAVLVNKTVNANGTYLPSADNADGYKQVVVNVQPTLTPKTITENGVYLPQDDGADGFDTVTVDVAGSGNTNVFQYLEFTPVTDATNAHRLDVQTDIVPSGTPWMIICAPKTFPPTPPSGAYAALIYTRSSVGNISTSILRADGTFGTDGAMAQYAASTGVLTVGGSYGVYRAGQTYCVWLLTIEV